MHLTFILKFYQLIAILSLEDNGILEIDHVNFYQF